MLLFITKQSDEQEKWAHLYILTTAWLIYWSTDIKDDMLILQIYQYQYHYGHFILKIKMQKRCVE